MANVKQCDKCKKIINREDYLSLSGTYANADGHHFKGFDGIHLCDKCGKEFLISIERGFKEEE